MLRAVQRRYYIEFCNCESLENYLRGVMEAREQEVWDLSRAQSLVKASKVLRRMAEGSRDAVAKRWRETPSISMEDEEEDDERNRRRNSVEVRQKEGYSLMLQSADRTTSVAAFFFLPQLLLLLLL